LAEKISAPQLLSAHFREIRRVRIQHVADYALVLAVMFTGNGFKEVDAGFLKI
jgi:hypothetical protein